MKMKISVRLAGLILLGAVLASACTQQYSQAPLTTPTLIPTGLFVSPFPSGQDPMQVVADLGTQTAMAKTAEAIGGTPGTPSTPTTPGTPGTASLPGTVITPLTGASLTPSPSTPGIFTPAPITVVPGATTAVPSTFTVPVGIPATYTLQSGEYVYCIARRYNLDPAEILARNSLVDSQTIYPGLTLQMPQSGKPFPGTRALHSHPDTYTVDFSSETLNSIACYYGDVFPEAIAKANNLTMSAALSANQKLNIP